MVSGALRPIVFCVAVALLVGGHGGRRRRERVHRADRRVDGADDVAAGARERHAPQQRPHLLAVVASPNHVDEEVDGGGRERPETRDQLHPPEPRAVRQEQVLHHVAAQLGAQVEAQLRRVEQHERERYAQEDLRDASAGASHHILLIGRLRLKHHLRVWRTRCSAPVRAAHSDHVQVLLLLLLRAPRAATAIRRRMWRLRFDHCAASAGIKRRNRQIRRRTSHR